MADGTPQTETRPEAPPQINCAFEVLNGAKQALWPGDPTKPISQVSGETLVQLAQAEATLAVAEELRALRVLLSWVSPMGNAEAARASAQGEAVPDAR